MATPVSHARPALSDFAQNANASLCAERNSPPTIAAVHWPCEAARPPDKSPDLSPEFGGTRECGLCFLGRVALGLHHCLAVVGLQLQTLAHGYGVSPGAR